jgi:hypothetical protein
VLDTLVESACRLCDADASNIMRPAGDVFKVAASFGQTAEHKQVMRQLAMRPGRDTCTGRVLLEGRTVHIPDHCRSHNSDARKPWPTARQDVPRGLFDEIQDKNRQLQLASEHKSQIMISATVLRAASECARLRNRKGAGAAAAREPRWDPPPCMSRKEHCEG